MSKSNWIHLHLRVKNQQSWKPTPRSSRYMVVFFRTNTYITDCLLRLTPLIPQRCEIMELEKSGDLQKHLCFFCMKIPAPCRAKNIQKSSGRRCVCLIFFCGQIRKRSLRFRPLGFLSGGQGGLLYSTFHTAIGATGQLLLAGIFVNLV